MASSSSHPTTPTLPNGGMPLESAVSPNAEANAFAHTLHSLSRAVNARKAEYVRPHRIRVKIGTWNVAACPGTDKDLHSWFVDGEGVDQRLAGLDLAHNPAIETRDPSSSSQDDPNAVTLVGGDKIGLYVLGLQEVIDLNIARTTIFADQGPMEKWKTALANALPNGYELVASEQLSGIVLLVYASHDVAQTVSNVSSVNVGTGLWGYMGNKGGVATRIVLGETTRMVFINSHLASGSEGAHLDRRCWDYNQILSRAQFEPIVNAGVLEDECEKIGDEDFAFWLGDLNFRLETLPGDDIRRLLGLHTRGEYDLTQTAKEIDGEAVFVNAEDSEEEQEPDVDWATTTTSSTKEPIPTPDNTSDSLPDTTSPGNGVSDDDDEEYRPDPHDDPASLQATLDSLLPHDQLRRVMKERKAFHEGWREGPITFLPTYKYDVGTIGLFDTSEKQRAPSWCDRILFRTRKEKQEYDAKIREEEEARRKDAEMRARGLDRAGDEDEVLFDYDPESDRESREISIFDYNENDVCGEEGEDVVTKEGFLDHIHLDIYTSHQRISSSDHKPIISIFTLDYNAVVPELKAKVHAEVARELDRAENEGRPCVTIVVDGQTSEPGEGIDFGDVSFLRKKTRTMTIANTGQVAASFSFVEKPRADDGEDEIPPWLSTCFLRTETIGTSGGSVDVGKAVTLEPGDTLSAVLDIHVSEIPQLVAFNEGLATMEDVLVLRVMDGRDHFVPIRGHWLPSSFGRSIEELIRLPKGGIRQFFAGGRRDSTGGAVPYTLDVHASHPRELFALIEAIEHLAERVVADENMLADCPKVPREHKGWPFDTSSWQFAGAPDRQDLLACVIESLDTGHHSLSEVFPPETCSLQRLEVVSEALLLFLNSLIDGIITAPLFARIETALPHLTASNRKWQEMEDDKTAILDILTSAPNHNISFVFMTAMLNKVVSELAPLNRETLRAFQNLQLQGSGGARKSFSAVSGSVIGRRVSSSLASTTSTSATVTGAPSTTTTTASSSISSTPASSIGFGGARRSLSFRRPSFAPDEVIRRMGVEEAFAKVMGKVVCRSGFSVPGGGGAGTVVAGGKGKEKGVGGGNGNGNGNGKERKVVEERMMRVLEVFFVRE